MSEALVARQDSNSLSDSLLHDYTVADSSYDEMCSSPGILRPHWRDLMKFLDEIGGVGLERRYKEVQRLLQEDGVTYNAYDDPRNAQRHWQVDPIPLLMTGEEWSDLAAGMEQRSRLFDALLNDLYGPRTVIRQGWLPPEMIYAHTGFLHACHQSLPAGCRWLIFHGVDLARGPDGVFRVYGDRTQSPSGAGYILENRIILARALPLLYRDAPLRRLASFLETKRATLAKLARHNPEDPHVVLLTPGPNNPVYFEHAYLANYLSLSLVEGEDLVVRDGRVWLKTLGGLRPVDVILRLVLDNFCDPLELRGDSLLGIPGLLQAVRGGHIAIANAIGSGIIENPGIAAFLPLLCQQLLGESLKLPSLPTWWCGAPDARSYVLDSLDHLVVRSILPGQPYWEGARLDAAARSQLIDRIQATPHLFVGQESLPLSTAPMLEDGRLVPRPIMLRGFTVVDGDGYRVMPGGLVRLSSGLDTLQTSLQGGVSKDWWVMAPTPQKHVSLLRQSYGPIFVTRDGGDLPSRVADNLFWLGRYSERLDSTARLLREAFGRLLEWEQDNTDERCLDDLLEALEITVPPVAESPRARFFTLRQKLLGLVVESEHPGSLHVIFGDMLRTGRAVRNHLGDDGWRLLNRIQQQIQQPVPGIGARQARELLEEDLMLVTAFCGLNNETMPHHQGWLFFDIGRYLERVLHTMALFKLAFITARNPGLPLWEVVLTITDNLTAYRRRYRSALHPRAIIDLLLFDEGNPRAVGYQLRRLQRHIGRLQRPNNSSPYRSAEERLILEATATLQLADIEALATLSHDSTHSSAELTRLLDALYRPLLALSDALIHSHFSHAEVPRQLITMRP